MNKFVKYAGFLLGAMVIVWVGLIIAFKVMVDPEKIRVQVEQQIYDSTGYKAVIKRVETSFWFNPTIIFYDVVVRSSKSQVSPRIMSATLAEMGISLFSVFDKNPTPNDLRINGFALDIEEINDGKYNISQPKAKKNGTKNSFPKNIIIERGRINYTPFGTGETHEIRNIDADIAVGNDIDLSSSFEINGYSYNLAGEMQEKNDSIYKAIISLAKSENDAEKIAYNGDVEIENGKILLAGEADFNFTNFNEWLHFVDLKGSKDKVYNILQNLKLNGKLSVDYKDKKLQIKTIDATLNDSNFNVNYAVQIGDKSQFNLKADLAKIEIKDNDEKFNAEKLYKVLNKLLFKKINGDLAINIEELQYNDTIFDKIALDATLVEQELVLNNSLVKMAGETDILLFGIVRKDEGDLINVDGSIEILGKDFQAFADGAHVKYKEFTNGNEGAFRGKSNIFISQDLNLFSNIKFQVGNVFLEGNVENRPKGPEHYNIALNTKNLSLDAFFDYVNPTANQEGTEKGYDVPKFFIPWLEEVGVKYHLNIALEDFNLKGEKGETSKIIMDVSHNQIRFSEVDFNWREMKVTGDLSIKQENKSPIIDCNLFFSEFNINDMVGGDFRRHPVERGNAISIWDDKPFDVGFMRGYDGNININIGVINHDSFTMRDVTLAAIIEDGAWNVGELSGAIWGGELNAKGEIDVSSIFSADMDFLFKGVMVEDLLQTTLDIRPMQGRTNIYGNINTGGISVSNLMDSLKGQVILSGRDVSITGFDIAGMLQTLPSVRNINDVANTVRVSLIRGKTSFATMEGAFYLDGGMLKSHGIKLRSRHAIGTIKGQSNLVSWDMNYGLTFKLPTLSTMEVAEISLFFKESMDNPLVSVDSRNLESFMAKRKIGR